MEINGSVFLLAESDESSLEITVPAHESGDGQYEIKFSLLLPDASYVASFRRHFMHELDKSERKAAELAQQNDELVRENQRLSELERELDMLKRSRVWRYAERMRALLYGRWLNRFPGLQKKLLSRARAGIRQELGNDRDRLRNLAADTLSSNVRGDLYDRLKAYWEQQRPDDQAIQAAIAERLAARAAKDFATSDRIRDELAAKGIQLKDGKDPATGEAITTWEIRRT